MRDLIAEGYQPRGKITAKHLEEMGVVSPPLSRMVKVDEKTYVQVPENCKDFEKFIEEKRFYFNAKKLRK